jgi:PKHD-type hydroxylase
MSLYNFAASPHPMPAYVTWQGGFSAEELDRVIMLGEALHLQRATVDGGVVPHESVRVSKTAWMRHDADSAWLYDRLAFIVRKLNGLNYRFDIDGFVEDFQYTVYNGDEGGHYDWHIDYTFSDLPPRKLGVVLQLSDPADYEGGDLEVRAGPRETVLRERGLVTMFSGLTLHRVSPVTSGIRRSLVAWVAGPAFR